jgi:hypothetical protein
MYNKKALKVDLGKYKKPNPYKGDIEVNPNGQWDGKGVYRIPSPDITMDNVDFPVWAQPNVGPGIAMQPGQNYHFKGADYVDEYPMAAYGGNITKGFPKAQNGRTIWNPMYAAGDNDFQNWYKNSGTLEAQSGIPYSDDFAYDYYSYFKNNDHINAGGNPDEHYIDDYKKPWHPVFSDQSLYSTPENPGGRWITDENGNEVLIKQLGASAVKKKENGGDISIPDLNQYEDGGEYDLTQDQIDELKKGGYIVHELSNLPKKKDSKKYSRSLTATNKLFAQNPLTKKAKSKKNKIFDPQAKQFEKGGFQDDINKRRQVLRDWTYGQSIGMLQKAQEGLTTVPTQEEAYLASMSTKGIPYADKAVNLPEVKVTPYGYRPPATAADILDAGYNAEMQKKADWERRSSGAAQPVDEFWTLPLAATRAPYMAVEALTGLMATELPGLAGATVGQGINAGFIGKGLYEAPSTVEAWQDVAAGKKDWKDAAEKTAWNLLDFTGAGETKEGLNLLAEDARALGKPLKTEDDLIDLWRIQEKDAKTFAQLAEEGKLHPAFNNPETLARKAEEEKYFGQWFTNNKADLDWYTKDREFSNPEIINLKVPKSKLEQYNQYDKSLSRAPDREFVIPFEEQQFYKQSPYSNIRSGLGGIDMSRYEIKNPDYFNQLLNTYTSKQLSPSNKKFYKGLIDSVKKQNGLVTERQYNELQRLKSGNFNFGKKAYEDGGDIEMELTPEEIQAYRDGGYIVDELD